ncbi:MAG: thioesterase family protein [Acutalibacteraceae bacterium]|nr:thioesterase family protein [Acutalibacteraceae bacterium]
MKSKTIITARYGETDMMGIVHHSVYALYYEQARVDFIKNFGVTYLKLEKNGLMLPLVNLGSSYKKPVYFADDIIVETSVQEIKPAKIKFAYNIYNKNGELVNIGYTEHGFVDSKTFKPVNAKKVFPDIYEKLKNSIENN